ncbi:MAG TPA: exopolysaccharide biosynthesis polyprenyl glycosylphosphotransferase [Candidatus Limnocylindrales bacterium]|nr:exopolysaccharide biosynthesis polyprenyl glycosylphosphotransferase [Candidatus Limnocylindrales bacterium]
MATKPISHPAVPIAAIADRRSVRRERFASRLAALSRSNVKKLLFLGGDVAAVVAAHELAESSMRHLLGIPAAYLNPSRYFLFYIPFFTAMLYLLEGYKSPDLRRPEKELEILFKGVSLSFVALACANFVLFKASGFSRYLLVTWYALTLLFLLAARFGLRSGYGALWRRGMARQKALLLGSREGLAEFERRLSIQRRAPYEIMAALPQSVTDPAATAASASASEGLSDGWQEVARMAGVQVVIVNLEDAERGASAHIFEIIRACQAMSIEVEVYSSLFGTTALRYERDEFSGYFRFYAPPKWSRAAQRAVKTSLDVAIGFVGSLATIALMPVIALLVKLEDGGPLFYRQEYIGTEGTVQHYLKFRTMVVNAQQVLESDPALKAEFEQSFKLKRDPRILRVGHFLRKFSIDEFPEFFSLLTGQLTFVGPRTLSWAQRDRYGALLPKLLSVKPGLTGFWQVMGRQTTTYEEKIQMDMFYIDHWSIWLDLVIVAKTFWEVVRANGAY